MVMYINTSILISHLKREYEIISKRELKNTTFCSFRIYDGQELHDNCLYIIYPEQLAFLNVEERNAAFLCTGGNSEVAESFQQDIVILLHPVDQNNLVNKLNDIFDLYHNWEQELQSCSDDQDGVRQILDKSNEILPGILILGDYYFNYIAYSKNFSNDYREIVKKYGGKTPSYVLNETLINTEYYKIQNYKGTFLHLVHMGNGSTRQALCYNLFRPGEQDFYARLIYINTELQYSDEQSFLLRFLGDKIDQILNKISLHSMQFSDITGLKETICNCISRKNGVEALIGSVLGNFGWNLSDTYILIQFTPYFLVSKNEINALACNQIELMYQNSCAAIYEDSVVLVINLSRSGLKKEDITHENFVFFLREHLYKAGISNVFQGFTNISFAYQETSSALKYGNAKNNMFWYYKFSDYTLDYMMHSCSQDIRTHSLCHQGLLHLIQYDEKHNTTYSQALETYMRCKYNVSAAAEALYLHRTTLLKHLAKISQLAAIDLDDWETRLHLMLSFWILQHTIQ